MKNLRHVQNVGSAWSNSLPILFLAVFVQVVVNFGWSAASQIHSKRIPIGAIFPRAAHSFHIKSAFRHELERHNLTSQANIFRLERLETEAHPHDDYGVSRAICSLISKGSFLLFGQLDRSSFSTVRDFTSALNMPYVTIGSPSNYNFLSYYIGEPATTAHSRTSDRLQPHVLPQLHQLQSQQRPQSVDNDNFLLYLRPSYDRALIDVILDYKWPKIFYVYDNFEGLYRLEKLYQIKNRPNSTMKIESVRLSNVDDSYMVLRHMDSFEPAGTNKYIVLDLSTEEALVSVLKQIQAVGMNRGGYHYLLGGIAFDEIDVDDFKHGGVNITGFSLINRTETAARMVEAEWLKLNSSNWPGAGNESKLKLEAALTMDAVTVMTRALGNMLTSNPDEFRDIFRRGLLYGNLGTPCRTDERAPWEKGQAIMRNLKEVNLHGITGLISFDEVGHRKDYTLGVYELTLNSDIKEIATWHYSRGLTKVGPPEKSEPDEKFEGEPLNRTRIVTTIISPPFLYKKRVEHVGVPPTSDRLGPNGLQWFEGYCAELTVTLAELVGFDFELKLVEDSKYGAKIDNGTWNGMVGELATKKADLSVAPLTISSIRERVIDFSKPFMNLGISIMIKKPEKQKPGVFSFMDPLAYDIWACIVISYLAVSFVLFLVSRFSPYEWQMDDSKDCPDTAVVMPSYTNDFTVLNSLWFSLAAFMRQGCDISPRSLSGRVVGSAWWFFTLIIISSYTANLAAFLTIERMLTPIQGADDLAKQREIMYGTLDAGSTKDFFRNSKISTYEAMWEFMSNNVDVFVKSTEDGVDRVRSSKGKYAFLLESTMNDYYNQKKPCNTMKVGGDLDSKGYGVATPIGSDLREPIGLAILQLLEKGYLAKLHKKWWYDKGECVPEDTKGGSSSQSALTLSNVAGIFYILIGGLGLSMLTSLLEFIYKSKREILKQKKTFTEASRPKTRMSTGSTPDRENGGLAKGEYPLSQQVHQQPYHHQQQQQHQDDSHHLLHHHHPSAQGEAGFPANQRPAHTAIVLV